MLKIGEWTYDNEVQLLENGEQYYPAVLAAMAAARQEILIETFILFDDEVGRSMQQAWIDAARRGVRLAITVDGYGSPDLPQAFVAALLDAGVEFRYFDPVSRIAGLRLNPLRRLHRKIIVIDRALAFVGGINFSVDHLHDASPHGKQDFAVQVRGPVVDALHELVTLTLAGRSAPRPRPWWRSRVHQHPDHQRMDGQAAVQLVWRDNRHYEDGIEQYYRHAIRGARHSVLIANAYFFPGYRFVRELRHAARRGVHVTLILQGLQDIPLACWAARSLYEHLGRAGVVIHECRHRPLHAKVAVIDGHWATIGSSNLDPSSLSLNLEANLIIASRALARELRLRLDDLIARECQLIDPQSPPRPALWGRGVAYLVYHLMRLFPRWQHLLPRHRPPLVEPQLGSDIAQSGPGVSNRAS